MMKKIGFAVAVCCLTLAASSFAGTMERASKEYKAPVEAPLCFGDHEFQADIFGAYADTKSGQGGVIRDHGWGGGVGLNYFFSRYFGLGVEGYWLDAQSDPHAVITREDIRRAARDRINGVHRDNEGEGRAIHNATGSFLIRYPIDSWCLAPYMYFGGGGHWDGDAWGSAHWGGGLEYRIVPQRVGLFVDGRFTVLADHRDSPIHNPHFTLVKAGVRFVF